jgi:hypothetical protein
MRRHRFTAGILAVTLALGMAVALAHDQKGAPSKSEKPDAKLSLSGTSAAIGVGTTWGSGTLTYKGKAHPIRLRGLEIGGVGGARIKATGDVYHLTGLADFDGTYVAVGAAAAAGAGAGHSLMRNEKGVVIDFASDREGVQVKAGIDGVRLELAGAAGKPRTEGD